MTAVVQPRIFTTSPIGKFAHLGLFAGEPHQRPDGETELHAQDDLARDEQLRGFAFAENADDEHGRNNGDQARDQPAQPRAHADVEKAFHHDLAGQRAGERGVLSGSEQRDGEEHAGDTDAQQRAEQFVGVLNFGDVLMAGPVKGGGREDQDGAR